MTDVDLPTLWLNQSSHATSYVNPRVVHTKTPDGKEFFALSGIVIINLKGVTSDQWLWERVIIGPEVPMAPGSMLVIEQAAPLVTISSMLNLGESINSGFAVDAIQVIGTSGKPNIVYDDMLIEVICAVRDSDAILYRLGYSATVIGRYEPSDIHP